MFFFTKLSLTILNSNIHPKRTWKNTTNAKLTKALQYVFAMSQTDLHFYYFNGFSWLIQWLEWNTINPPQPIEENDNNNNYTYIILQLDPNLVLWDRIIIKNWSQIYCQECGGGEGTCSGCTLFSMLVMSILWSWQEQPNNVLTNLQGTTNLFVI